MFAMAAKYENDKAVRMNALNSNGGSSNLISSNISQMMMLGGTRPEDGDENAVLD